MLAVWKRVPPGELQEASLHDIRRPGGWPAMLNESIQGTALSALDFPRRMRPARARAG